MDATSTKRQDTGSLNSFDSFVNTISEIDPVGLDPDKTRSYDTKNPNLPYEISRNLVSREDITSAGLIVLIQTPPKPTKPGEKKSEAHLDTDFERMRVIQKELESRGYVPTGRHVFEEGREARGGMNPHYCCTFTYHLESEKSNVRSLIKVKF